MKKYISFIATIFFILSSCGIADELEIISDGDFAEETTTTTTNLTFASYTATQTETTTTKETSAYTITIQDAQNQEYAEYHENTNTYTTVIR